MANAPQRLKAKKTIKFNDLLSYERRLKEEGCDLIIGVDEAGRGPLAGPVVAAAVALKTTNFLNRIDDSKKLSPILRDKAFTEIVEKSISGLNIVSEKVIDEINILEASRQAMRDAVSSLLKQVNNPKALHIHVIVDGNMHLDLNLPQTAIVGGDAKSMSIAAASILAKVTRDSLMLKYDALYPVYGFARHKGYPTDFHRNILKEIGPCQIHRKSFYSAARAS